MILEILKLEPIKFHRYRSGVRKRLISKSYSTETEEGQEIESIRNYLHHIFDKAGIENYLDNKTVFECDLYGNRIFIGFYDLVFAVGFDYFDENEEDKQF